MHEYADENFYTDTVLFTLANSRRRICIRYLADHEPVELRELANVIAEIKDTSQKSAYTSLDQTHIKRLKAADIVERANGTKSLKQGENYARAKLILDCCDQL